MGVIYIGDRETGKTSLALELANPSSNNYVKVLSPPYSELKARLWDSVAGRTRGTSGEQATYNETLEIEVIISNYNNAVSTCLRDIAVFCLLTTRNASWFISLPYCLRQDLG